MENLLETAREVLLYSTPFAKQAFGICLGSGALLPLRLSIICATRSAFAHLSPCMRAGKILPGYVILILSPLLHIQCWITYRLKRSNSCLSLPLPGGRCEVAQKAFLGIRPPGV